MKKEKYKKGEIKFIFLIKNKCLVYEEKNI